MSFRILREILFQLPAPPKMLFLPHKWFFNASFLYFYYLDFGSERETYFSACHLSWYHCRSGQKINSPCFLVHDLLILSLFLFYFLEDICVMLQYWQVNYLEINRWWTVCLMYWIIFISHEWMMLYGITFFPSHSDESNH